MAKTFFIGDTHFRDKRIELITGREHEEEWMINRWNNTVGKDDIVYHLGDFASSNIDKEELRELIGNLHGKKYLIMGNHDRFLTPNEWRKYGFVEVYDHPIIIHDFFILTHEPLWINDSMPYGMAYAHIHNNPIYQTKTKYTQCFSVERTGFAPIEWELYNNILSIYYK